VPVGADRRRTADGGGEGFDTLELDAVAHAYVTDSETVPTIADVSLTVRRGEFVTVVGPSGCGKSTLFNLATGLIDPTGGVVRVNGERLSSKNPHVAYMFQQAGLLEWRDVLGNALFGAELLGVPRGEARRMARTLTPTFGLEGFEHRMPWELSGGMRQRVALLRTYLTRRELLLLDEPFGALDALTRLEMQQFLLDTWQRDQRTVVFVTHDVDEAVLLGDRVVVLSARPTRVVEQLEIDLPRPRAAEHLVGTPRFTEYKVRLLARLHAG